MLATPAHASGSYNNATIATDGLADLGQNPAPGGGQCKAFANAMVIAASSGTQSPSGYQTGWANAGGVAVSSANAAEGDIIQITPAGSTDLTAESLYNYSNPADRLHTAIIVKNNGNDSFTVVDANFTATNTVGEHTFDPYTWAAGSIVDIWRMGTVTGGSGGSGGSSTGSRLSAVSLPSGQAMVYWKGSDSGLWSAYWSGSQWYKQDIGFGPIYSPPAAVYQPSTGWVQVFWEGPGHTLYQAILNPSTGAWVGGWNLNVGSSVYSQPTAAVNGSQVDVYWTDSSGNLQEGFWTGSAWAFFEISGMGPIPAS
jgi:hypothetical protein